MLIALQRPNATYVAGFGRWLELKRFVRKGEKGIAIIAPCVRKTKVVDKSTNEEREAARISGFRTAYVFDVEQTDGEPIPELGAKSGEVPAELQAALDAAIVAEGITLESADELGGALGVSRGGSIAILSGLSSADRFAVTVHEFAHELLHRGERRAETDQRARELEAEAVAYVVCRHVGINVGSSSADYVQLYGGDVDGLYASLEFVRKTSARIIDALGKGGECKTSQQ